MFSHIEQLSRVTSTNEYLKQYVAEGLPRAVRADEQTEGRGRQGRRWDSPAGGLYASYLLFPRLTQNQAGQLNQLGCLAIVATLEEASFAASDLAIKRPNDVLIGKRKVSGVLVDMGSRGDRICWAIVGIGLNLAQRDFVIDRPNLDPTSLHLEGVRDATPQAFFDILTTEFIRLYREMEQERWHLQALRFEALIRPDLTTEEI